MGLTLVSNTHGISSLLYSLSMTDAESGNLKMAQKALNNFLWNWIPPKVKHNVMISVESCLKTIDIESQAKALRLPYAHRILHNTGWVDFDEMYVEQDCPRTVPRRASSPCLTLASHIINLIY